MIQWLLFLLVIKLDEKKARLDVNQFKAKAVVHLENADDYKFENNGKKCKLITRKNGESVEAFANETAKNIISTTGILSKLIIEM